MNSTLSASEMSHKPSAEQLQRLRDAIEQKGWRGLTYHAACIIYYGAFTIMSIPIYKGLAPSLNDSAALFVVWMMAFVVFDIAAYRRRTSRLETENWVSSVAAGKSFLVGDRRELNWKLGFLFLNVGLATLVAVAALYLGEQVLLATLVDLSMASIFVLIFALWLVISSLWAPLFPISNSKSFNFWNFYDRRGQSMWVCGRYARDIFFLAFLPIFLFCMIIVANLNLHSDMMSIHQIGLLQLTASLIVGAAVALPFYYKQYAIARSINRP